MSTSTTFSTRSTLAENWDTETLINFLRDLNINLDEDDFKILRREKIVKMSVVIGDYYFVSR